MSFIYRAASVLAIALSWGCSEEARVIVEPTPWAAVQTAFGDGLFDPEVRQALFSESAQGELVLSDALTAGRYRFLSVAELRRMDDDRRIGEVAFTVDGWPASLEIEVARGDDGGWRIDRVARADEQQRLLDLLGPTGLPIARDGEPWAGGLAGRDAAGRPTAAVLVKVHNDRAYVDGGDALPISEGPVRSALEAAIKTRRELADDAHATYRPHVALAIPRAAPSGLHVKIADWAVAAGAEALQLVVRSREGTPAWLPLARRVLAQPGAGADAWRLMRSGKGWAIRAGADRLDIPDANGLDREALVRGLRDMAEKVGAPEGLVVVAHADADHGTLVQVHLAARSALPGIAMTGEVTE